MADREPADGELDRVLARWLPPDPQVPAVAVAGPPGCGRSALTARLRAAMPGTRFTDGPEPTADLVLMVFDAAAPIGREELGLLDAATTRGADVVLVLARIDAHRGWRTVLGRDAALLAEYAPAAAGRPILPVSAVTGAGLSDLCIAVGETVARPASNPLGAAAPARALAAARAHVLVAIAELRRDDGTARLRERRAALIADRDGPRTEAAATLRRVTAHARVDLTHLIGERVRLSAAAVRSALDRADRGAVAEFPQWLREEVAALTVDVDAATSALLNGIGDQVLGAAGPVAGPNRPPPTVVGPPPRPRGVEDRMVALVGASAGLGAGRLVMAPMSGVAALDLVAVPLTLLIGGGAAWWLTRMRGHVADRAHLRHWVTDTMAQVRSDLEQRALSRLVDVEAEVTESVRRAHRARAAAVEESLAGLDRELRESVGRNAARLSAVERDLAVLDRALADVRSGAAGTDRLGGASNLVTGHRDPAGRV
ncbi:hypothetical protein GCM10023094_33180 [Rhodococcus olei]|uniref:Dynamin family protein n=1 Tax=Rhodococcus olei TaxID=2161675 RepID=A0ABP8P9V1_9NOCA